MSKGSEAVAKHRQSKLGAGWVRIDGLLPPESAKAARAMVECGEATSLIHAAAVALSERSQMKLYISRLEQWVETSKKFSIHTETT